MKLQIFSFILLIAMFTPMSESFSIWQSLYDIYRTSVKEIGNGLKLLSKEATNVETIIGSAKPVYHSYKCAFGVSSSFQV